MRLCHAALWVVYICLGLALVYAAYVQLGGPEQDAIVRARGCGLCHDLQSPLPALRAWQRGEPLRPLLLARLEAAHPLLSSGAAQELADYLLAAQLPALAQQRAGAPGQTLYMAKCAACHGRSGEGDADEFPPLRGSEWLTQEPSRLQEILTNGLNEPIYVRGRQWHKTMRPPGLSTPQERQYVIDFLRAHMQ